MANGRIEPGQPLSSAISASAWNRAQDAADIVLGPPPSTLAGATAQSVGGGNLVYIKNDTGFDVKVAGVLGINGIATNIEANATMPLIVTMPVLSGVVPTHPSHADKFAVTVEPIKAGKVGRAAVSGVVAIRLYYRDANHKFCNVSAGLTDRLDSTLCGTMRILATGPGADSQSIWAVGVF